jgi:hypothetical protein
LTSVGPNAWLLKIAEKCSNVKAPNAPLGSSRCRLEYARNINGGMMAAQNRAIRRTTFRE